MKKKKKKKKVDRNQFMFPTRFRRPPLLDFSNRLKRKRIKKNFDKKPLNNLKKKARKQLKSKLISRSTPAVLWSLCTQEQSFVFRLPPVLVQTLVFPTFMCLFPIFMSRAL